MERSEEGRRCRGCDSVLPEKPAGAPGRPKLYCTKRCQQNTWDRECYRGSCVDCGGETCRRDNERCRACFHRAQAERHEELLAFVEWMYNNGCSIREIKEGLGYGPKSTPGGALMELRRAGRIGYRYKAHEGRAA